MGSLVLLLVGAGLVLAGFSAIARKSVRVSPLNVHLTGDAATRGGGCAVGVGAVLAVAALTISTINPWLKFIILFGVFIGALLLAQWRPGRRR